MNHPWPLTFTVAGEQSSGNMCRQEITSTIMQSLKSLIIFKRRESATWLWSHYLLGLIIVLLPCKTIMTLTQHFLSISNIFSGAVAPNMSWYLMKWWKRWIHQTEKKHSQAGGSFCTLKNCGREVWEVAVCCFVRKFGVALQDFFYAPLCLFFRAPWFCKESECQLPGHGRVSGPPLLHYSSCLIT